MQAPSKVAMIHESLMTGRFKSDGFYTFDINERGKIRHIKSVTFRERVVQKCLCDNVLVPIITRRLIYDNGASQKGKGYHFAIKRLETHLREHFKEYGSEGFILIFDFHSYFDTIRHDICKKIIREEIEDERIRELCYHFIDCFGEVGIGLGSQISQILAIRYADEIDKCIKKYTIKSARYMDDGYAISHSKEALEACLEEIKEISARYGLVLNLKKTRIIKLKQGFTFLKVRVNITETGRINKRISRFTVTRARRRMKKLSAISSARGTGNELIEMSYASWRGYAKHFNSWKTIKTMDALYKSIRR